MESVLQIPNQIEKAVKIS